MRLNDLLQEKIMCELKYIQYTVHIVKSFPLFVLLCVLDPKYVFTGEDTDYS